MKGSEEMRAAEELQREIQQTLTSITNKIESLPKIRSTLKAQVIDHFESLFSSLSARKDALLSEIDKHLSTLEKRLEGSKQRGTTNLQICTQVIAFAPQVPSDYGSTLLKTLTSLPPIGSAIIPQMKVLLSDKILQNIENEGEFAIGPLKTLASFENCFWGLNGITFNPSDRSCYVLHRGNNKIYNISLQGEIKVIAGHMSLGVVNGIASTSRFHCPSYIALNRQSGILYVTDTSNHLIRKLTSDGIVGTIAGNGKNNYLNGKGLNASFNSPRGIEVDQDGFIYVSDNNESIRKISPEGEVTTIAGNGRGFQDGSADDAQFASPAGLSIDSTTGDIYVADEKNNRIRKISSSGEVSTVAGTGAAGCEDGDCADATFNSPQDVKFISTDGSLLVADTGSNRIRRISQGRVGTISYLSGDDASSVFGSPTSIAFDSTDYMCYVVESKYSKIQQFYLIAQD